MKALMIAAGFCGVLAGCEAVAPADGVAAANALALASTGTGTDHGISFASGCAVWRASDGLEICEDDHEVTQAAAAAEVPALAPEQPAEIVGEEGHDLVLDGRS